MADSGTDIVQKRKSDHLSKICFGGLVGSVKIADNPLHVCQQFLHVAAPSPNLLSINTLKNKYL